MFGSFYSLIWIFMKNATKNSILIKKTWSPFPNKKKGCSTIQCISSNLCSEGDDFLHIIYRDHIVSLYLLVAPPINHELKVKDIIWQDLRFLSFYLSVCLSVCGPVCLCPLCTPHFWSHNIVNPYLGCIHEQFDAVNIFL